MQKTASPPTDPLIGTIVDNRYRIVRLLGAGGMGAVYEAEHLQISRRFALKCMHARAGGVSDQEAARFRREARAVSAIKHPHVVETTDMGLLPDGRAYLVLELLEGEDLGATLEREGRLSVPRALEIARQVLEGLEAVHRRGIVHRDLKPANVFLSHEHGADFVRICDFGISKLLGGRDEHGNVQRAETITGTGQAVGTPLYMAPEQLLRPDDIDARVDVYAAGVMLYEMLSGRRPFEDEPYALLLQKICSGERPSLRAHCPEASPRLERVVLGAFAFDRDQRPASCAELAAELQRTSQSDEFALGHAATLVSTTGTMARPRPVRRLKQLAVALALGLVTWFAGFAWTRYAEQRADVPSRAAQERSVTASPPALPMAPRAPDVDAAAIVETAPDAPALRPASALAANGKVRKQSKDSKRAVPESGTSQAILGSVPASTPSVVRDVVQNAPQPSEDAAPEPATKASPAADSETSSPVPTKRRGLLPVAL